MKPRDYILPAIVLVAGLGAGLMTCGGQPGAIAGAQPEYSHNALDNLSAGDPHTQYLPVDGSRGMTGELPLFGNPTGDLGAAPKQYVDSVAGGAAVDGDARARLENISTSFNIRIDAAGSGGYWNYSTAYYQHGRDASIHFPDPVPAHESTYNHAGYGQTVVAFALHTSDHPDADNSLTVGGFTPYTTVEAYGVVVRKSDGTIAGTGGGTGTESYIKVSDSKASGTDGGTFASGAWRTRTLNTEDADTGGYASLSSNQITLAAGTYRCRIRATAHNSGYHKARLRNATDNTTTLVGTSEFLPTGSTNVQGASVIAGLFTIVASKVFEVQHYCTDTTNNNGFGYATGSGEVEVYVVAEFWREN